MSIEPAGAAASRVIKPMNAAEKQAFIAMLGENYRMLEYTLPDLRNATIVLETMLESVLSHPEQFHDFKRFDLTEDQVEGLTYAIRHVGDLARALSKTYYQGYETPINVRAQS